MTSKSQSYDYLIKLVLIGDSSVGKSNLALRYSGQPFSLQSKPTIGVQFCSRTITVNGKVVKAQVWDTAGQERFRAITNAYYKGANGAIVVYDVTRALTFQNVQKWMKELKQNISEDSIPVMLLGNKIDLQGQRMVKTEEGKNYADENHLFFIETTAKDQKIVNQAFDAFIVQVYEQCKQKNTLVENKRTRLGGQVVVKQGKKQKGRQTPKKSFNLVQSIKTLDKQRCCV